MIDNFPTRARQITFAARFKAGERGARMIDVDDFLVALVLEDQGLLVQSVFSKILEGQGTFVNMVQSHTPFFSSETVKDLLVDLETHLPQSQPVAFTTEVPLSPSLVRIFNSAEALQSRFKHSQIEPLHLLAGPSWEKSRAEVSDCCKALDS